MKIFISHSGKDANLANILSNFLESISYSVDAFCSSQIGSIKNGSDFVDEITNALSICDIFIPLLTKNYYESRFCMIELGFAFSTLSAQSNSHDVNYIYPLAVSPIEKAEALANTPLSRLQVCSINDMEEMSAFIETLCNRHSIASSSGLNKKIRGFINDADEIIYSSFNTLSDANIQLCKAANVIGENQDYLEYSQNADNNGYTIKFRAKPFESSTVYSDFLSVVFKYIDKINLYEMVNIYPETKICAVINNLTNSINKIDIEIKYSDNNQILHIQNIALRDGENKLFIPLKEIKCKALKTVSEICFVITPSAYNEDEGMFQINNFSISNK